MIRYRYTRNGQPLVDCPFCSDDLTDHEICGVDVTLVIADSVAQEVDLALDKDGHLVDTEDGAIAKGFHSETRCGRCNRPLTEFESKSECEETVPPEECEFKLIDREIFALLAATSYAQLNADDINEALQADTHDNLAIACGRNDSDVVFGAFLESGEYEIVADRLRALALQRKLSCP